MQLGEGTYGEMDGEREGGGQRRVRETEINSLGEKRQNVNQEYFGAQRISDSQISFQSGSIDRQARFCCVIITLFSKPGSVLL